MNNKSYCLHELMELTFFWGSSFSFFFSILVKTNRWLVRPSPTSVFQWQSANPSVYLSNVLTPVYGVACKLRVCSWRHRHVWMYRFYTPKRCVKSSVFRCRNNKRREHQHGKQMCCGGGLIINQSDVHWKHFWSVWARQSSAARADRSTSV